MAVNIPANSRIVSRGRVVIGPHSFGLTAVGGNIVQDISLNGITYRVHTFTSSGILSVTTGPSGAGTIEYLLVGAGGGGSTSHSAGGGGGAGGFITGNITLTSSGPYTVTVGTAGGENVRGNDTVLSIPSQGITFLTAFGGGNQSTPGGSGGGGFGYPLGGPGGGSSLSGQGNPGGPGNGIYMPTVGGGGGGAGSPGNSGRTDITPDPLRGVGGSAKESYIRGYPEWFAAGGGATNAYGGSTGTGRIIGGNGSAPLAPNGINGVVNTGSGGGGATGNSGGSGIAIIRYRIS